VGGETNALVAVVTWLYHFVVWLSTAPWNEVQPFIDRMIAYLIVFIILKWLWHWAFAKKFKK
jgi:hypothetical protein